MSKLKTKSSVKKRFRSTASGKLLRGHAFKRHNLRRRPNDMKLETRGLCEVHVSDEKRVKKHFAPYGLL